MLDEAPLTADQVRPLIIPYLGLKPLSFYMYIWPLSVSQPKHRRLSAWRDTTPAPSRPFAVLTILSAFLSFVWSGAVVLRVAVQRAPAERPAVPHGGSPRPHKPHHAASPAIL